MACSVVQISPLSTGGANPTRDTTFGSTPAVGSVIVVVLAEYQHPQALTGITDNQGNTYHQQITRTHSDGGLIYIYTADASISAGTFTVTVTYVANGTSCAIGALEIAGSAGDTPDQTAAVGDTYSMAISTGAMTPSAGSGIYIDCASTCDNNFNTSCAINGAGRTEQYNTRALNPPMFCQTYIGSGAQTLAWDGTTNNVHWVTTGIVLLDGGAPVRKWFFGRIS